MNYNVPIIIRTKNEERWIASCLDAVFSQSYKNFEVRDEESIKIASGIFNNNII